METRFVNTQNWIFKQFQNWFSYLEFYTFLNKSFDNNCCLHFNIGIASVT